MTTRLEVLNTYSARPDNMGLDITVHGKMGEWHTHLTVNKWEMQRKRHAVNLSLSVQHQRVPCHRHQWKDCYFCGETGEYIMTCGKCGRQEIGKD